MRASTAESLPSFYAVASVKSLARRVPPLKRLEIPQLLWVGAPRGGHETLRYGSMHSHISGNRPKRKQKGGNGAIADHPGRLRHDPDIDSRDGTPVGQ